MPKEMQPRSFSATDTTLLVDDGRSVSSASKSEGGRPDTLASLSPKLARVFCDVGEAIGVAAKDLKLSFIDREISAETLISNEILDMSRPLRLAKIQGEQETPPELPPLRLAEAQTPKSATEPSIDALSLTQSPAHKLSEAKDWTSTPLIEQSGIHFFGSFKEANQETIVLRAEQPSSSQSGRQAKSTSSVHAAWENVVQSGKQVVDLAVCPGSRVFWRIHHHGLSLSLRIQTELSPFVVHFHKGKLYKIDGSLAAPLWRLISPDHKQNTDESTAHAALDAWLEGDSYRPYVWARAFRQAAEQLVTEFAFAPAGFLSLIEDVGPERVLDDRHMPPTNSARGGTPHIHLSTPTIMLRDALQNPQPSFTQRYLDKQHQLIRHRPETRSFLQDAHPPYEFSHWVERSDGRRISDLLSEVNTDPSAACGLALLIAARLVDCVG